MRVRSGLIAVCVAASGSAFAADIPPRQTVPAYAAPANPYDLVMEVGAGAEMRPAYEGASKNEIYFWPTFTLYYLRLPGFAPIKNSRYEEGFSFSPSFRYIAKRKSADYSQLSGLNDVDASFEIGGKFAYTFGMFRPWVAVRQGFGGHDGIVGETGLDLIWRPDPALELTFGPRASFATADYMRTYFGVTPLESIRSGLPAYDPSGGFKGVGASIGARYEVTPEWAVIGSLTYEKLIGDAANSPIVKVGDDNQFTARLGLAYKFGLRLWN